MEDKPKTILELIKPKIHVIEEDDSFDDDLEDFITMSLATLNQLGVGNSIVFDKDTTYEDFFPSDQEPETINLAKSYIRMNVQMLFDTPATGAVNSNNMAAVAQLEWRVGISVSKYDESK